MFSYCSSTKTLKLNTGATIPVIGLGTWQSPDEECYSAVLSALHAGYRHIDTARIYQNEEAVGKAVTQYLKESGTSRDKLFITTKLWCSEVQDPEKALEESLKRLNLEYVDLYLMHWPVSMVNRGDLFPKTASGTTEIIPFDKWNYVETYKIMQKLYKAGLTKAIGISNFNIPKIDYLLAQSGVDVVPACLQVEIHPYLPQFDLVDYCTKKGILVECYSPLGSTGAPLLKDPALIKLGEKYGVSPACIAISWAVARDTIPLPKSVHEERIVSNLKVVDLADEDISLVDAVSKTTAKRLVKPEWGVDIFGDSAKL